MEVLESSLSGLTVLKVTGDLDHLTAAVFEQAVRQALSLNGTRLFLDLTHCPYLDSGGLSVLLYALREVRGKGWLGVIAPSRNVGRLFEITGLSADPDFRVFPDSTQAMAALEV